MYNVTIEFIDDNALDKEEVNFNTIAMVIKYLQSIEDQYEVVGFRMEKEYKNG